MANELGQGRLGGPGSAGRPHFRARLCRSAVLPARPIGPAGALLGTLARIGWRAVNAVRLQDDEPVLAHPTSETMASMCAACLRAWSGARG